MTDSEKREAARQFIQKWQNKGREDEDDRSFWLDMLQRVFDISNATDRIEFQKKVIVDGNTKRIDAYIPETRVIIEQKSLGVALDKKIHQSGDIDLTPYEQAKRYDNNLPSSEKARWIVTCNFAEIWVYDMDTKEPEKNVTKIALIDLKDKYSLLDFLISSEVKNINQETAISLQAGEIVGKLYEAFLKQYNNPNAPETLQSLNKLCVRIVFCLYAEDAGIFGSNNLFHNYLKQFDARGTRKGLISLFKILDTKPENRDPYLKEDDPILASFPYVNGGLFADEEIEIPPVTDEIYNLIVNYASSDFDWSLISPTIFGAVFESTLNPVTRRSGGMHYTSIENIHKVIDPLFLDDLKAEIDLIENESVLKTKITKAKNYQKKLAGLTFLDPACGSGNFLTETYISLRRLENRALKILLGDQIRFDFESVNPIMVSINNFYGIEINDFAVTVAKTALWIAESQMMKETEDIIKATLDFLPLKNNAGIIEGNALRLDWNDIVSKDKLNYIMGNPPFVGYSLQSESQKNDILSIYIDERGKTYKSAGKIDYVAGWYFKASSFIYQTNIQVAFVSTNSITQGEQVSGVWKPLYKRFGIQIIFAHRTFRWDSEANLMAHVHCVIVGFSTSPIKKSKVLYSSDTAQYVNNINAYLIDGPDVFLESLSKPICDVPVMRSGGKPVEGGNLIFTDDEKKTFLEKEPAAEQYFRPFMGSDDFINGQKRWCLWLVDVSPKELRTMPFVLERIEAVREFRLSSKKAATREYANHPSRFMEIKQPESDYLMIPATSSEKRIYIPIGFLSKNVVASNAASFVPDATLYHFGILTSNVHMAWMRVVCGRLEMRYRYSVNIVYNNFPWPSPSEAQKTKIEQTAQGILDARAMFPDCSLADLYDPLTMHEQLRKAHRANDRAVMEAYGFDVKNTSEADCVARLMQMYKELTSK